MKCFGEVNLEPHGESIALIMKKSEQILPNFWCSSVNIQGLNLQTRVDLSSLIHICSPVNCKGTASIITWVKVIGLPEISHFTSINQMINFEVKTLIWHFNLYFISDCIFHAMLCLGFHLVALFYKSCLKNRALKW